MFHELDLVRPEIRVHVKELHTLRFALIYWGPLVLFFAALILARASGKGPEPFGSGIGAVIIVLPHVYGSVLDWFRSRARVLLDEIDGRLRVTVPLLGQASFSLDSFKAVEMVAPAFPPWVSRVLLLLAIAFLVALEVSHLLRGAPVEPENIVIAGMGLASAFQMYRQRDYRELVMWFGSYADWRRFLWTQRKVSFRGREEVLQELKRWVVEVAAGN